MDRDGKKTERAHVHQNVSDDRLTVEELKQRSDSLIENIGALQFSITRIESLDGYRRLLRDLLEDCRVIVAAHGHKTLVRKIDKALKTTVEN